MRKAFLAGAGGVTAALLGSLCCAGPVLFVTLGIGAGLASTFEPLRPLFAVIMVGLFAIGFYTVYGRGAGSGASSAGEACELPRSRRKEKAILWGALVIAAVLWTFPMWSTWLV